MQANENTASQAEGESREIHGEVTKGDLIEISCEPSKGSAQKSQRLSGMFHDLWRWISEKIVQDVPEDSAICEFDCKKGQCTMSEWAHCERRLNKAAPELWPGIGAQTPENDPSDQE